MCPLPTPRAATICPHEHPAAPGRSQDLARGCQHYGARVLTTQPPRCQRGDVAPYTDRDSIVVVTIVVIIVTAVIILAEEQDETVMVRRAQRQCVERAIVLDQLFGRIRITAREL